MPLWTKWPDAPAPFTSTYTLGFVVATPMLLSILFWVLAGLPGIRHLSSSNARRMWFLTLLLLVVWTFTTQLWAFARVRAPGVAQNAALQLALVAAFLIVNASIAPRCVILGVLIGNMLLHGALGAAQVTLQSNIGIEVFALDPQQSGVSVIQAGAQRWLRPYGLLPHPNVYAGIIVVGLLATCWWLVVSKRRLSVALLAFAFGLWSLLLSFSRGAWLGFGAGVLFALFFVMRQNLWQRLLLPLAVVVLLGAAFFAQYQPLILARAGVGQEGTEQRSIVDRVVYWRIAQDVLSNNAAIGLGAGNFPWYAADYLFYRTDYDLRGDNVHNVPMLVWSELGIVGLVLLIAHLMSAALAIVHQQDLAQIALLAGAIALFVVGLFDHYPWTLIQTQSLWLGLLAVGLAPTQDAGVAVGSNTGTRAD